VTGFDQGSEARRRGPVRALSRWLVAAWVLFVLLVAWPSPASAACGVTYQEGGPAGECSGTAPAVAAAVVGVAAATAAIAYGVYLYIQGALTPAQFEELLAGQMAVTTVRVGDERVPILPATGPAVPFDGRVLLVGEGNFSFTASNLALGRNAASNVTATAYSPDGSYPDEVRARAEELRRAGADVQFQVDARALPADLAGGAMFDTIVFQFPHPGGLRGAVSDRGRVLLRGFFTSATSRLNPGGQIAVTLGTIGTTGGSFRRAPRRPA